MKKRVLSMLIVLVMIITALPITTCAVADEAKATADGIASKYASTGVADDDNAPWLAADMVAYLKTYPETSNKLTDAQKQDMADVAIAGLIKNTDNPSNIAKYIISLVALGYDPTQITTSTGTQLNAVTDKLIAQTFADSAVTEKAKNEYALPYILIAFQQFGNTYSAEIEKLIAVAIETADTWNKVAYYYEGDSGSVDAITPMMLALAPYYERENVQAVIDNSVSVVKGFQSDNGSIGENAASTGLGAVAFAALGMEPDSIVQTDSENSIVDYLLTQVNEEKNGFEEPWGGSFNTEQGFRGLLAVLNAESGTPYYLFDFSGQSLKSVTERPGVTFDVIPEDATVVVKNSAGEEQMQVSTNCYNLEAGEYTYTVSMNGYVTKSGTFSITDAMQKQTLTVTLSAVADEVKAIADGIASKYASTGVADDDNAPWLAADMVAYLKTYPETSNKLTDAQKQDMADVAIAGLVENTDNPSNIAKYIISLVAMGYDPRQITTSTGTQLNAVTDKLIAQTFTDSAVTEKAKNEYALPYILIAFQQFGNTYSTEIEKLIAAAIETADTWNKIAYWYDGDPGSVDAVTPMMLALAPYYERDTVQAVINNSVSVVKGFQSENGSIGENTASTGLGAVAFAALGIEPDSIVQTDSENSIVDYLLTQVNEEENGFEEPWGGSFNTEQGFRGLLATLNAESGTPYYLFDFSGQSLQPVTERPGVTFDIIPSDATVVVKNSSEEEQTQVSANCYNLETGEYTYTVSKNGYVTKNGTFSITDAMQKQTISVSLASAPSGESASITVTVKVLTHNETECDGKYTYKNNADKYTEILANERVTLRSGQTVFDALEMSGVDYDESSPGYIGKIGDDAEFGHSSDKSGWLYRVNGVTARVGCRAYKLTSDATVIWFYTDDYTSEYGSESFGSSSNRNDKNQNNKTEEKTDENTEITEENNAEQKSSFSEETFVDVNKDDWHYESVKYVYENNLMQGTESGFEPDEKMTRAMLVTVLYRLENPESVNGEHKFADVADGEWYSDAVSWAAENGVVSGISDTSFAPDEDISREQMAVIIYRYAKLKGYDVGNTSELSQFADNEKISDWALEAFEWANAAELVNGTSESSISPQDTATRAQVATILMRFCENIVR